MRFEWDESKSETNRRKHGIDFDEAQTVFADTLSRIVHDPDHSDAEARMLILGMSHRQRLSVVVFTERSHVIRLISARLATRAERRDYEEE